MTKELKIMFGIAVIVIAGGILLFTMQPKMETPGQSIDEKSLVRDTSHMTGKIDAKVTVVEFGDYECPACKQAAPIVARLRVEYKDNTNVNFVFRNFPLPQHGKAMVSAQAAEAAGSQGKFWEMYDQIYEHQKEWIGANDHMSIFSNIARDLQLDVEKFKQAVNGSVYADVIQTDKKDGETLGVNSTPTFFINGEKVKSYAYEELKSKIEEKLK